MTVHSNQQDQQQHTESNLRYSADKFRVTVIGAMLLGLDMHGVRDAALKQLEEGKKVALKKAQQHSRVYKLSGPIKFATVKASDVVTGKVDIGETDWGGVFCFQPIMMGTQGFKLSDGYTWYRPKCRFKAVKGPKDADTVKRMQDAFSGWLYSVYYALALLDVGCIKDGMELATEALKGSDGRLLTQAGRRALGGALQNQFSNAGVL